MIRTLRDMRIPEVLAENFQKAMSLMEKGAVEEMGLLAEEEVGMIKITMVTITILSPAN